MPIISTENWKPATKTDQGKDHKNKNKLPNFLKILLKIVLVFFPVIQALIALVNDPEPEHPLRGDLAEEFLKDHKKFLKNAEEYTRKYGEKRPNEY